MVLINIFFRKSNQFGGDTQGGRPLGGKVGKDMTG
jgi:hypothetical protein